MLVLILSKPIFILTIQLNRPDKKLKYKFPQTIISKKMGLA